MMSNISIMLKFGYAGRMFGNPVSVSKHLPWRKRMNNHSSEDTTRKGSRTDNTRIRYLAWAKWSEQNKFQRSENKPI